MSSGSRLVLQLTGNPGAGKTEVSKHLSNKFDFTTVLVSDLIREYAQPRNIALRERKDYRGAHAQLLSELGQQAITNAILHTPSNLICVDGIRVSAHVETLRKYGKVIALDCPPEIRFQRVSQRNGLLDPATFEEFLEDERQEYRSDDPFVQGTLDVMDLADYLIDSSQPFNAVIKEVEAIVQPLLP